MVDTGEWSSETKEHAVSDEHDSADAAGDGSDTESGGRTAVVTRPQRPSGKRSRQRADEDIDGDATDSGAVDVAEERDDTRAKDKPGKKAKKARGKKKPAGPNPIVFVFNYLKQVVAELRKVIWPNRKQMMTYTSVVLVFLAFMVALVGLADLGLAKLVMLVFGSHS
jgi:preprotein translocase subunit SecE